MDQATYSLIREGLFENETINDNQFCISATYLYSPGFLCLLFIFFIFNIIVVGGNLLVIAAALTSHKLKESLTNAFIINLAVSDLFIGSVILPLSITRQILKNHWIFGRVMCDIWLSVDVWLSTASILNLVIISFDRFLAICRPLKYPKLMTHCTVKILVACVWIVSFVVSLPIIFVIDRTLPNSTDSGNATTTAATASPDCLISKEVPCTIVETTVFYTIYSAMGSFFLPLLMLSYFYLKIFLTVYRNARNLRRGEIATGGDRGFTMRIHRGGGGGCEDSTICAKKECLVKLTPKNSGHKKQQSFEVLESTQVDEITENENLLTESELSPTKSPVQNALQRKQSSSTKSNKQHRETKAAKMLAIICGAFIGCWMPFFTVYLFEGCKLIKISIYLFDVTFWLGYFNSALNPIIYALLSRHFRAAFRSLLCGHRLRKKRQFLGQLSTSYATTKFT